jgi:hypothetical protein
MRYQDFIGELRSAIAAGDALSQRHASHQDTEFRAWRHQVQSLVDEAQHLNYRVPGKFKSHTRSYMAMWSGASAADNFSAFQKDLGDSLIELRFIVENFEKYGEPMRTQLVKAPAEAKSPAVPERVTLAWLVKHVSVSFWAKTIGFGVGILLLGAAIGRTAWLSELIGWFKANWPF